MNSALEIIICYALKDETLMKELEFQLKFLEQQGHFTIWHDGMVKAGVDWQKEQTNHLNSASIILLLISADFLSLPQNEKVIKRAMERYHTGEAKVIPIILRPTMWERWDNASLGQLKALPKDGRPVTSPIWHNHDEAFMNVAEGILQIVEELQKSMAPEQHISNTVPDNAKKEEPPMNQDQANRVFLCHNTKDKPQVKEIAIKLKQAGINPWLDEWELRPGLPWIRALEAEISTIASVAVFIGKDGRGPWHNMEMEAALHQFVYRQCPIIPVLLADAPDKPDLPLFLGNMTWVDFRQSEPDPMKQLIWGVTNTKPDLVHSNHNPSPSTTSSSPTSGTPTTSTLSFEQKIELVDLLLNCSCMQNNDSRQTVLGLLNEQISGIARSIPKRSDDKTAVLEIVSTCAAHPGAIQKLVNIVAYFELETSMNTQNLKAFVQKNGL